VLVEREQAGAASTPSSDCERAAQVACRVATRRAAIVDVEPMIA
jgi:hypothetical protein